MALKIMKGEYVDFYDLPLARGALKEDLPATEEGRLVVYKSLESSTQQRRLVPDLATWVCCYAIYCYWVIEKHPEKAQELLAYMVTIVSASQQFTWPSWAYYDRAFRMEASMNPYRSWWKTRSELYSQWFTGQTKNKEGWCRHCLQPEHCSDQCPYERPNQTSGSNGGSSSSSKSSEESQQSGQCRGLPEVQ